MTRTGTLLACTTIFLVTIPAISASNQEPFSCEESTLCATKTAVSPPTIITSEFSETVRGVLNDTGVRGLSLGIVRRNGWSEFGAWGIMTEDDIPVDANTQFHIGSCTKAFLSASLGILMDDFDHGRNTTPLPYPLKAFSWETKLKNLIPDDWKPRDQFQYERTNLRDILSHVSGLAGHDLSYGPDDTMENVVKRQPLHYTPFELREAFAYNNEMYVLGSFILEKYSGISFGDFARKRIFQPLGMNSTFTVADAAKSLSQSWSTSGRRIPFWFSEKVMATISGAGSIISSASDMTKWLTVMLNEGYDPVSNSTIIPTSAFRAVTTVSSIVNGLGNEHMSIMGYGLGWGRYAYRGHEIIAHTGGLPGFLSSVNFLPWDGVAIVSLTNTDGGDAANSKVVMHAHDALFGLEEKDTNEAPGKAQTKPQAIEESHGNPSLPLNEYAGIYGAPDYGNFTLCTLKPPASTEEENDSCRSVRKAFKIVDETEGYVNSNPAQLIASWPRIWQDQLRLTHLAIDTFSLSGLTLFTEGYGKNTTPFAYGRADELAGTRTARFVITTGEGERSSRVTGFFACGILRDTGSVEGDCVSGEGARPGSWVWFSKL